MKRIPLLLALLILLLTPLLITACAPASGGANGDHLVPIYYLAPEGTFHGSDAVQCSYEMLDLGENAPLADLAAAVTHRLLEGSGDKMLISPFPEDVQLVSLRLADTHALVDFTGSFALVDGISLTLADYCLTLSLTAIDGIESVSVTVNGRPLAQQPRQIFRERDAILSTKESDLRLVTVSLFFVNEDCTLVAEERVLELYEGDTQSEALVAALLTGPKNSDLTSIIPDGFHIASIRTEDGICRISIPSSALETLPENIADQRLILHSLARSLYSLEYIREIRLQTDGEELQKFGVIPVSEIAMRPDDTVHTLPNHANAETAD